MLTPLGSIHDCPSGLIPNGLIQSLPVSSMPETEVTLVELSLRLLVMGERIDELAIGSMGESKTVLEGFRSLPSHPRMMDPMGALRIPFWTMLAAWIESSPPAESGVETMLDGRVPWISTVPAINSGLMSRSVQGKSLLGILPALSSRAIQYFLLSPVPVLTTWSRRYEDDLSHAAGSSSE